MDPPRGDDELVGGDMNRDEMSSARPPQALYDLWRAVAAAKTAKEAGERARVERTEESPPPVPVFLLMRPASERINDHQATAEQRLRRAAEMEPKARAARFAGGAAEVVHWGEGVRDFVDGQLLPLLKEAQHAWTGLYKLTILPPVASSTLADCATAIYDLRSEWLLAAEQWARYRAAHQLPRKDKAHSQWACRRCLGEGEFPRDQVPADSALRHKEWEKLLGRVRGDSGNSSIDVLVAGTDLLSVLRRAILSARGVVEWAPRAYEWEWNSACDPAVRAQILGEGEGRGAKDINSEIQRSQ